MDEQNVDYKQLADSFAKQIEDLKIALWKERNSRSFLPDISKVYGWLFEDPIRLVALVCVLSTISVTIHTHYNLFYARRGHE